MLHRFASPELEALLAVRGPCLSLVIPERARTETFRPPEKDVAAALREAAAEVATQQLPAGQAAALLDSLAPAVERATAERGPAEGAVVFSAPGLLRAYRLEPASPAAALVGERPYLLPLVPMLDDARFHLLAISLGTIRLLEGDRDSCRRVEASTLPANFEEAVGRLQYDSALQQHTGSPSGLGRRSPIVHGHGDADSEHFEADLRSYFRIVARALEGLFGRRTTPLVLASVAEYFPLLRAAELPWTVLAEGIAGSPDKATDRDLHARALPIVREWSRREVLATVEGYGNLAARGQASSEVSTVLEAALSGRVRSLLVAPRRQLWGTFRPSPASLVAHPQREPGDEDLVNWAVCETLRNRGTVWEVDPADLPADAAMAAVFRY